MVYADVVVAKRGSSENLTYAVPAKIIPYIKVGSLVAVPVRNRKVKAVVLKIHRRISKDLKTRVREIISIDKKISAVSDNHLQVVSELSKKYLTSESDIIFRSLSSLRNVIVHKSSKNGKLIYLQAVWQDRIGEYKKIIAGYEEVLMVFPTHNHLEEFQKTIPKKFSHQVLLVGKSKKEPLGKKLFLTTVGSSFLPLAEGGLIIIDQPSHIGSRYSNRPYLKALDIALTRRQYEGINVVVAQSLISPKQLLQVKNHGAKLISIELKKTKLFITSRVGSKGVLLPNTEDALSKALDSEKKICVFVASKGWASGYYCRSCQELTKCRNCNRVIGATPDGLNCAYCGHKYSLPKNCDNCKKDKFVLLGEGIDFIVNEIKKTLKPKSYQVVAGKYGKYSSEKKLTVATEKILSFPNAKFDEVFIISADRALSGGALDDKWRFLLILKELAATSQKMFIQTYLLDSPVWNNLENKNLKKYFEQELNERKKYKLPPYSNQLNLIGSSKYEDTLSKQLGKITETAEKYSGVELSTSEYMKEKNGHFTVKLQIIFPYSKNSIYKGVADILPPNWAVMPT